MQIPFFFLTDSVVQILKTLLHKLVLPITKFSVRISVAMSSPMDISDEEVESTITVILNRAKKELDDEDLVEFMGEEVVGYLVRNLLFALMLVAYNNSTSFDDWLSVAINIWEFFEELSKKEDVLAVYGSDAALSGKNSVKK